MGLLDSKIALVTGGTRGIGKAIATKFAEEGAKVAFTFMSSEEAAMQLEAELKQKGPDAMAIKSDASSYADSEKLISDILEKWDKIDVVVNNAGITKDNLMLRMSEEQWDDVINTNLKSVFNVTKQVLKPMMKARRGSIINLTSIVGMKGQGGQANYAASKAGIIGFTKSVADELGSRGIRSNAIAPGFIQTDMTDALPDATREKYLSQIPLNRFGETEEVANTALFLASDLSSYISGQTISVCGALNR